MYTMPLTEHNLFHSIHWFPLFTNHCSSSMAQQSTPTHRFVGTLQTRQTYNPVSLPAIVSLQRYNTYQKVGLDQEDYTCTLCWKFFEKPCYTVGSDSRIICVDCWKWLYDLSVCWTCGEVVFRKDDAVGFGWCWWHWGCFSCLICSVSPLRQPQPKLC